MRIVKQSDCASGTALDRLDMLEAAAYRDMFAAAPRPLSQALGLDAFETAGATMLIAPGIPSPQFNRVIGLGNRRSVSEAELDALTHRYRAAGVRDWWVQVSPSRHASGLIAQLDARGFALPRRRAWVKLARDDRVVEPVRTGAEVREAQEEERNSLAESVCGAFDMPAAVAPWLAGLVGRPGWRSVLAMLDGKIVGGGFLNVQGEGAWLGASGVRASARGRHVHRALMTLRIEMAIAAGCRRIATETGEPIGDEPNPSLRNMYACGFATAYSRLNYAAPAA
jgi:GNAT superfamily N-acetyltransferase